MPLSKRQKRRLLEVSKMIESSIVVKDDMEEIQLEYAHEIDGLIDKINRKESPKVKSPDISTDMAQYEEKDRSDSKKTSQTTNEHQQEPNPDPPKVSEGPPPPEWAKKLWKGIAKKCHPDRLSFQELTAIQIARRQVWFLEARSLFEKRSWPKLIHIGVQVGEYVEELSHRDQLNWLSKEYNDVSKNIESIQSSLAWQWGTNWENTQLRVNIITTVLAHKGLPIPPKDQLIDAIMKFELD